MSFISWSNNYSVKIEHIDEQHKNIINLINQLHDAMKSGKGQEVIEFKPWLGCDYCYARVNNKGHWGMGYSSNDLKKVREIIKEYVRIFAKDGKMPRSLRFGERTETYMPELRDTFFTTMQGAFLEGVQSVISTKTLEYSLENAKLLKEFNASVLIPEKMLKST